MTEAALLASILREFGSRPGLRLWRQNTGAARTSTGALVRFGVPGQADISGIEAGKRAISAHMALYWWSVYRTPWGKLGISLEDLLRMGREDAPGATNKVQKDA